MPDNFGDYPTQAELCPTGEETCCDMDFEECWSLIFSFQLDFQRDVIGDSSSIKDGPLVPINVVTDASVRSESPGTYSARSLCGTEFDLIITEVLFTSDEILDALRSDPATSQNDLDLVTSSDHKTFLFEGKVNESMFRGIIITTGEGVSDFIYLFVTDSILPPIDLPVRKRSLQDSAHRDVKLAATIRDSISKAVGHAPYKRSILEVGSTGCADVFDDTVAAVQCPPGQTVRVQPDCRSETVATCESSVGALLITAGDQFDGAILQEEMDLAALALLNFARASEHPSDHCSNGGWQTCTNSVARNYLIDVAQQNHKRAAIIATLTKEIATAQNARNKLIAANLYGKKRAAGCISCECEDPDDPCCNSTDPCCSGNDPCCDGTNPCCKENGECDSAGVNGDPHMVTFDNMRYSCQGKGEYIIFEALSSGALVQSRFERPSPEGLVSLATGVAARGSASSKVVELSIPKVGTENLEMFVADAPVALGNYEDADVKVTKSDEVYTVFFKETGLNVVVHYIPSSFNHISVHVRIPPAFRKEDIRGLLGSPDDNSFNDWMDAEGATVTMTIDQRWEDGYNYCTSNWCIRNESQSLFKYTNGYDFNFFFGCNETYPGKIDVVSAPPAIFELCGMDEACLIDGSVFGDQDARELLELESMLSQASVSAHLRAVPSSIVVGYTVNTVLTVNLTGINTTLVDECLVFLSGPGMAQPELVLTLNDTGSGIGDDLVAGDSIFSGVLPLTSATAGESFTFMVMPKLGGNPVPLLFIRTHAVRSFSELSGIGVHE